MQTKITYIIATWLGHRRASYYNRQFEEDPYFLIKQHITSLSVFDISNIEKILIVINQNDINLDSYIQRELEKINCKLSYEIITRPNFGFSYGAWEHGIQHCIHNGTTSDFFFLIEDDYIPAQNNFHQYFLKKFSNETIGSVFQLYTEMHGLKKHAAISNGMVKRTVAESCLNKYGNIFNIKLENTYISAQHNQETFLDYIEKESEICDISDIACIPFYDINFDCVRYFGNCNESSPIVPIYQLDLFQFKQITIEDAEFINFIRNSYCDEYLHTSNKFTVNETKSWILKTNPLYYVICYGNVSIGYFRISNYSIENKNLYIGADIHPNYTGLKLAYPAYMKFINFLFESKQLNKITLEVLETNTRAINLYNKLGFIYEGQKRKEILKNNEYIDSIIMSILKEEWNNKNF
jgi:RimJ/RimL family protein N-acetyltransferase